MLNRKYITLTIALFVILSLVLSGCNPKEVESTKKGETTTLEKKEDNNNNDEVKVPVEEIKQTRSYRIFKEGVFNDTAPNEDKLLPQEVMKRTGIEFELEYAPPGEDYKTKLNLYMASGDMPDMFVAKKIEDVVLWADQGAIIPVGDLIENYGSNIKKAVDPLAWKYMKFNDDIWAIPNGARPEAGNASDTVGVIARWDWIQKLGFEDKVMSEDFDLDQYHELLKAMTFNDPDGNGKDDTYGLGEKMNKVNKFEHVMGAFGLAPWVVRDGKVVAMHMTDEYIEALKVLRSWYEEGLIDPEFVIVKDKELKEKASTSKIGTVGGTMWWCNPGGGVTAALKKTVPEGEFRAIVPPKGPNGNRGMVKTKPGGGRYHVISSTAPNPELLFKLLDYVMSDEGAMLAQFGLEDEHYTYDSATNRITQVQPFNKADEFNKQLGVARLLQVTDRRWSPEPVVNAIKMTSKYTILNEFYSDVPAMKDYPGIDTYVDEALVTFVVGEATIEDIKEMQNRWINNGGQVITDQVNEEWNKMNK